MSASSPRAEPPDSAWTPDSVIRTKLQSPPLRAESVSRPHLCARLAGALTRPLALISAPVGYGKTTLAAEWAATCGRPAAWVTLDARDNHLGRFGVSLVAALATLEVPFDRAVVQAIQSSPPPAIDALVARLVDLLTAIPDEVVLVLDDYHALTHPLLHAAMVMLIQHLPSHTHLVLLSRTEPPLPLAQWRARDQLIELHAADLRFTASEAEEFFRRTLSSDLPAEAIQTLLARTEGWPAGLHLAARALRAGSATPESFNGSHRFIADYLAGQILQQQPEHLQRFLLDTSMVERFTTPLCDEMTDDSRLMTQSSVINHQSSNLLDSIDRANLFLVPLDDERRWFRYHTLFAEFLRARLRATQPERAVELHRRAAAWHERHGFIAEAVTHALAMGEPEQAASLLEQIAETIWRRGEIVRLQHWLAALPETLLRTRPRLCIFHAWILNIAGDVSVTSARLNDAERELNHARRDEDALLRGMLAAMRAIVALMTDDAEGARELSQRALALLPASNAAWRSLVARNLGNVHMLRGETQAAAESFREAFQLSEAAESTYFSLVALYELAELQLIEGRLHAAAETCRRALALAEKRAAGDLLLVGAIHTALAEVLREWNQLEDALRHAQRGVEIATRNAGFGTQLCAYIRLGLIERTRGEAGSAAQAFALAARIAPPHERHRTSFRAHSAVQAQMWARVGDWRAAEAFLAAHHIQFDSAADFVNEPGLLLLARIHLAQARPAEALKLLARVQPVAGAGGRIARAIEAEVLSALAHAQLNRPTEARNALTRALAHAAPHGYVRILVDEGESLRVQMVDLRLQIADSGLRAYLNDVLNAFGGQISDRKSKLSNLVEALSDRELDVLRLIAQGLSNQQIADTLVVALSTVQTHLKHLYGKLHVHSRTQAVARARELGMIE